MPYQSFYEQQRQNFKNPLDVINQGGGASSVAPNTTQGQTVAQNLATAPALSSLTDLVNTLNRNAQTQSNQSRVPGALALEAQSSANIGSELRGQLPADVINQIEQQGAERGVAIGSPGSDNSNAAMLRALGLDSLALEQQGQQNLSAADARNPVAPIFDPTTQFLSPYQQGTLTNQSALLGLDWFKALMGGGFGAQGRNYGGGTPVSFPTTQPTTTNWWDSLTGGTTSPASVTATSPGITDFGTYAANAGFNPGAPYTDLPDLSNPSSFDTFDPTGTLLGDPNQTNYDPFAGYA